MIRPGRSALAVAGSVLLGLGLGCALPATAAPRYAADACAELPGELAWSARERWVWQQVCSGLPVDLAARHPEPGDELTASFLQTMLTAQPYRGATHGLVRIAGAHLRAQLDLDYAALDNPLALVGCRCDGGLTMQRAQTKSLSFSRSRFGRDVTLTRLHAAGSLDLTKTRTAGKLVAALATVDGTAAFSEAVGEALVLNGTQVGQAASLSGGRFERVDLSLGQFGALLFLGGSFGDVSASYVQVPKLMIVEHATVGDLDLTYAKLGGFQATDSSFASMALGAASLSSDFQTRSVKIAHDLTLDGATIGNDLTLLDVTVGGRASFVYLSSGNLHITNGSFGRVDLSAAKVNGDLTIAAGAAPIWRRDGALILRNASARAIEDRTPTCPEPGKAGCQDPLPPELDLNDFTYQHLGGLTVRALYREPDRLRMPGADREHWERWLTRETDYSPQAYAQMAATLHQMAYGDEGTRVQFDAHDRQLANTPVLSLEWFLLWLDRCLIGYGYYPYWAGYWALALLLMGTVLYAVGVRDKRIRRRDGAELANREWVGLTGLVYSFDTLIPLITLRKSDESVVIHGWLDYYFYVHRAAGWLLATFLAAGISGLTK